MVSQHFLKQHVKHPAPSVIYGAGVAYLDSAESQLAFKKKKKSDTFLALGMAKKIGKRNLPNMSSM